MQDKYKYTGWVPCINGHLDFGLTQVGLRGGFTKNKKDKNVSFVNYSPVGYNDRHERNIAMQSWVDWSDRIEGDGVFRVCMIAHAEKSNSVDDRTLKGKIIIYAKCYETENGTYHGILLDKIHDMHNAYKEYVKVRDADTWIETQTILNNTFSEINKIISEAESELGNPKRALIRDSESSSVQQEIYIVDFVVQCDGLSFLNFRDLNMHKGIESEDKFVICRQAFYYLKYSLHMHKHHEVKADALTTIVENDATVGMKLACQIKRELTSIKRLQRASEKKHYSSEAIGIIGYLNSLYICLRNNKLIAKKQYNDEIARLSGVEKSFNAQRSKFNDEVASSNFISSTSKQLVTMAIAIFSFGLLTFVNLFRAPKSESYVSPDLINFISGKPSNFVLFMITFISCLIFYYFGVKEFYKLRKGNIAFIKNVFEFFSTRKMNRDNLKSRAKFIGINVFIPLFIIACIFALDIVLRKN